MGSVLAAAYQSWVPVVALAVWILMAWLGYLAGASRGRGVAGALLGFFLGPIGILAALFLPRNPAHDRS